MYIPMYTIIIYRKCHFMFAPDPEDENAFPKNKTTKISRKILETGSICFYMDEQIFYLPYMTV